jgi:tetratricopeptide (TPR) repeat protein
MADRFAYAPLIGLLVAMVFGIENATVGWKRRRRVIAPLLGMSLLALAATTRAQVPHWHDSLSVWEHALQLNPDNPIVLRNTAIALLRSGESWEAINYLRRAIAIAPEFADARNRLGRELTDRGNLAEANRHLTEALATTSGNAAMHYNMGRLLFLQHDAEGAIHQFNQALAIQAGHLDALRGLGVVLTQEQRYPEAASHLQMVLEQQATDALAYFQLGVVQSKMNQLDAAIANIEKGLEIAPEIETAREFLAELQEKQGVE